jgi:hypothetical protein
MRRDRYPIGVNLSAYTAVVKYLHGRGAGDGGTNPLSNGLPTAGLLRGLT